MKNTNKQDTAFYGKHSYPNLKKGVLSLNERHEVITVEAPEPIDTDQFLTKDEAEGEYAKIEDIPASQVNSDWNATSGVAEILNKPSIDIPTNVSELTNDTGYITSSALTDINSTIAGLEARVTALENAEEGGE